MLILASAQPRLFPAGCIAILILFVRQYGLLHAARQLLAQRACSRDRAWQLISRYCRPDSRNGVSSEATYITPGYVTHSGPRLALYYRTIRILHNRFILYSLLPKLLLPKLQNTNGPCSLIPCPKPFPDAQSSSKLEFPLSTL